MNHLKDTNTLRNNYYALRHGHSEANRDGIILSDPRLGVPEYGLTELGIEQVRTSVNKALRENNPDLEKEKVIIISSDFKRAKETTDIAKEVLQIEQPAIYTPKLRERFFGDLEKTSNKGYDLIWSYDKDNSGHTWRNVESVDSTLSRSTGLIKELDNTYTDKTIILVSHGDTLQILQTGYLKIDPRQHRSVKHLNTAELRKLVLQK
jgi:probable phosphoglycerate mutase